MEDSELISFMILGLDQNLKADVMDKLKTIKIKSADEFKQLVKTIWDIQIYQEEESQSNRTRRVRYNSNVDIREDNQNWRKSHNRQDSNNDIQRLGREIRNLKFAITNKEQERAAPFKPKVNKNEIECFKCKQKGHFANECKERKGRDKRDIECFECTRMQK